MKELLEGIDILEQLGHTDWAEKQREYISKHAQDMAYAIRELTREEQTNIINQ